MTDNNLWLLTEEKLKISVLTNILEIYIEDNKIEDSNIENLKIKPIIENNFFKNQYEVENFKIKNINKIYSIIVSGTTSFVDHLLFEQENKPIDYALKSKNLKYFIEDTKTDTAESRNTAFGQRATKTVIADFYNKSPFKLIITASIFKYDDFPESAKFDSRCLMTTGVEIFGIEKLKYRPFKNVEDLILEKNSMRMPPSSNVPFRIEKLGKNLNISKKIIKGESLSDPSIGQILNVSFALRKLGFMEDITITKHGLNQKRFDSMHDNKLLLGCHYLKLNLEKIKLPPKINFPQFYWQYPKYSKNEKHATILFHHLINYRSKDLQVIFDHHAGCARNYIKDINNKNFSLDKSPEGKTPDLVVLNKKDKIIYMIEGKTHDKATKGIKEMKGFWKFFNKHLVKDCGYKNYKMESWLILSGTSNLEVDFKNVLFNLKEDNSIKLNDHLNDKFKGVFKGFLN